MRRQPEAPKPIENKPEEIVHRDEQHFYSMPDTCEMFLAALSAIQDYHMWVTKRGVDPIVTLHCPNKELEFLAPAIEKDRKARLAGVVCDATGLTCGEFDHAVKFDPELAYKISLTTETHVTQVFGIMIGSDPTKVTPDVSLAVGDFKLDCDIMLLPFTGQEVVYDFLCNNRPELNVQQETSKDDLAWQSALRAKLLVGVRSGLTYLAASAGLSVVEIYPTDRHRNWISKWSSGRYQMIYGNPGDIAPDLVYRAIEAMWRQVEQRERAMVMPKKIVQEAAV